MKILIKNRKAKHNYEILNTFEAGISLLGPEVKSILKGSCSIGESFVVVKDGEAFIHQMHITKYDKIDGFNEQISEVRQRKLLLHKHEIKKINKQIKEKGLTIVPLSIKYSDSRRIKIDIAVCRGKKLHDKRQDLKEKDMSRDMNRKRHE